MGTQRRPQNYGSGMAVHANEFHDDALNAEIERISEIAKHTSDWVNVVEMGADNTGNIDCSALVQSLLDTYSTVYFPKGNYRFNSGLILKSHKSIIGESSRRNYSENSLGGVFLYFYNATGYAIESEDGAVNITLANFCMLGNYNGGGGIRLYNSTSADNYHKLTNIKVLKFSGDNIVLEKLIEPLLFDIQSFESESSGLRSSSFGIKVTNCQFFNNKKHGIIITDGGGLFTGCKIFTNGNSGISYAGIALTNLAHGLQFTGCAIHENFYHGIMFDGTDVSNNVITGASIMGNNKALGQGCDIVIDGSYNIINGNVVPNVKHSDGNDASSCAIVKVQPTARHNDIDIVRSVCLSEDAIFPQFYAKTILGKHVVLNEYKNPLNKISVNGIDFSANPLITSLSAATYTKYEVNGTVTNTFANDILTVTLGANDTLPVASAFDIDSLGKTGIKVTLASNLGTSVSGAYVEFEAKMTTFDSTLGVAMNMNISDGTPRFFKTDYGRIAPVMSEDWVKIKEYINFATPIATPTELNLIFLFIANTAGTTANRTGNSFSIRNFKYSIC